MPTYHFDLQDGSGKPDPEPANLPDYKAARGELVTMAGLILKDVDGGFWKEGHWQMNVTDERGLILCSLQILGTEAPAVKG